jgi:hypothetical protein
MFAFLIIHCGIFYVLNFNDTVNRVRQVLVCLSFTAEKLGKTIKQLLLVIFYSTLKSYTNSMCYTIYLSLLGSLYPQQQSILG